MPHPQKYPRDMKNFSVPANDAVRRLGNCNMILNTTTRCRPGPKSAVRTVKPLQRSRMSSTDIYALEGHFPPHDLAVPALTPMQHGSHRAAATRRTPSNSLGRSRSAIIVPTKPPDAVSYPIPVRRMEIAKSYFSFGGHLVELSPSQALPRATRRRSGSKHCSPYFRYFLLNDKSIVIQGSRL